MINLNDVEAKARNATPGRLLGPIGRFGNRVVCSEDRKTLWCEMPERDAQFAAAADPATVRALVERVRRTEIALEESVKLQSHYARLLNIHDGGERIGFENAEAWLNRLDAVAAMEGT